MALGVKTSFLKHTHVSKSGKNGQKEPYTSAAHLRYISRSTATQTVYSERMPSNYWAAQRFLNNREDGLRKNGRVIDKLVIVFPEGMKLDHAVEAVRGFGFRLTEGRTPFYFTLQSFDTDKNRHCHFILVDSDIETGKRVVKTTDRDSTERIKDVWERSANDILEREGYDFRLDRHKALEQKAELEAEAELAEQTAGHAKKTQENMHDGHDMHTELANPIHDPPPDAPAHQLEQSPLSAHEQELVQTGDHSVDTHEMVLEDGMAEAQEEYLDGGSRQAQPITARNELPEGVGRIVAGEKAVSVVARVRGAYQLSKRVKELHGHRHSLTVAVDWRERAAQRSEEAAATAARLTEEARAFSEKHTHGTFNGKPALQGFQAPAWSILPKAVRGWQSAKRKEAVSAQEKVAKLEAQQQADEENARTAKAVADQYATHTAKIAEGIEGYAWMTPEQQRAALVDMEAMEKAEEASIAEKLEDITADELFTLYKTGALSADEALIACKTLGFEACAETIRHEMDQQQGQEVE